MNINDIDRMIALIQANNWAIKIVIIRMCMLLQVF